MYMYYIISSGIRVATGTSYLSHCQNEKAKKKSRVKDTIVITTCPPRQQPLKELAASPGSGIQPVTVSVSATDAVGVLQDLRDLEKSGLSVSWPCERARSHGKQV